MEEICRFMSMGRMWSICIALVFIVGITGCTATIKQYPTPSENLFEKSRTIKGVSAFVQPLLYSEDIKAYFGTDMLEEGILPIYLVVKNDTLHDSFILDADSIKIEQKNDLMLMDSPASPTSGKATTGKALTKVAYYSGLLMGVGAAITINSLVIDENFEAQKFRTKTVDPGQSVSGFIYCNRNNLKDLDKAMFCFQLLEPFTDKLFNNCLNIKLKESAK